jgi:predicted phage baseplate assembly protein
MSPTDFEALARDASRSVARARCLTNTDDSGERAPGHITVVIVPDTQKADEEPRRLLRDVVADSLKKKAANTVVAPDHIHVNGARYVKLTVKSTIVPASLDEAAQVEQEVLDILQRYIHPLTGGPDESGWEFGRGICRSEIFALLERVQGVDHVADLTLSVDDKEQQNDITIGPDQLVFSGEHKVNFKPEN